MRPQALQHLKHGKFICEQVYPSFVETWNYIIERLENIKGDGDQRGNVGDGESRDGYIKFDTTDPEHPVIRFIKNPYEKESEGTGFKGAWYYNTTTHLFENSYVQVGNQIYDVTHTPQTQDGDYYIHIQHPLSGSLVKELVLNPSSHDSDDENSWYKVATIANGIQTFQICAYPVVFEYI